MKQLDTAALQALVERYFAAVDRMDVPGTLACFAPEAHFCIANHGTHYHGLEELRGMYERLNARYARVWHGDFDHVLDVPAQRAASRFRVENTSLSGEKFQKNNCNFFRVEGGRFVEVFVYMSGENSLG